ncbi:UDP-N-acetyl glucosamine 2-epimerase [Rhodanobacter sp. Root561]|uniref:non-hydrolyzing UDP-N-acetylglucosamine 2-epimerase n=1 Tax=Rhodanobacter sp. Root561 TaxID=1736560 RepID=UPI0006FD9499|nr:UDP-N-acetylglucosamine 2-epimerase (non-hydrolyzing) [Rhodanobacter sp. Root561]KQZ79831.1 UDP-N-acetyl glucosamine 2-epimerase [Rhodanobacter sp. Root561]
MPKLVTIVGARPQFIKAAVVSRAMSGHPDIKEALVHTGQHYDVNMSDIFFEEMSISKPAYHLGVGGGTHGAMTGRQLEKIEEVLIAEKPDWVLVYGDTNSTLAGALAAAKLHIPVAHVEAGLRSFNRRMPEEINRVVTDHVATLLFAPTEISRSNLLAEGISESKIEVVGDVMYDAAIFYKDRAVEPGWFKDLPTARGDYVLCTIHRAENTDNKQHMQAIFSGLAASGLPVILPLHPRTRSRIAAMEINPASNIFLTDPVGYLEMIWLEMNCRSIATDSGGVQKEAYFHGKSCVTMREETEWVELVDLGCNKLTGPNAGKIAQAILDDAAVPESARGIYGSGSSGEKILDSIYGFKHP